MEAVLSSSGWLSPALAAMELCQMCVQGMWDRDPALQPPMGETEIYTTHTVHVSASHRKRA